MSWTEPGMVTSTGAYLTLSGSDVHIEIDEMIATITTTHTYTNNENTNIEAVYTFPVPQEAVLLLMQATIGDRTLKGYYVEREQATRRYEQAISDGDSAVLVEHVEDGMQSMSVGNIMAGESVTVTIKYGLVLRWNDDTVRMQLPSTISPRYGTPPAHRPAYLEPVISMFQKNTMRPKIIVRGILSKASVSSPSHRLQFRFDAERGELVATSSGAIVMDRDLILTFVSETPERSWALAVKNDDETSVLAGLHITVPSTGTERKPIEVMYVIDCSGSMAGDSIKSARTAMLRSIQRLTPNDRANVIAFGSHSNAFSEASVRVDGKERDRLLKWCSHLDADMGGTNANSALMQALQLMRRGAILFLTDGEVYNWEVIISTAKQQNVRIFTIGIGSAPNMPFIEQLATSTGGAAEFISPSEDVGRAVDRQSARMLETGSSAFELQHHGNTIATWTDQQRDVVYDGDTILYSAVYSDMPRLVSITRSDGFALGKAAVTQTSNPEVARIAASLRLPDLGPDEAKALALKHQLLSKYTSCLVVDVRVAEEKAHSLPELRQVAQTLSAGWGGMGELVECCAMCHGTRIRRNGSCVICEDCDSVILDSRGVARPSTKTIMMRRSEPPLAFYSDLSTIDETAALEIYLQWLKDVVDKHIYVLSQVLATNFDLIGSQTFDEFFADPRLAKLYSFIRQNVVPSLTEREVIVAILKHLHGQLQDVSDLPAILKKHLSAIDAMP